MTEEELTRVAGASEQMTEAYNLLETVRFGRFGSENVDEFCNVAERYWQLACKITGRDPSL